MKSEVAVCLLADNIKHSLISFLSMAQEIFSRSTKEKFNSHLREIPTTVIILSPIRPTGPIIIITIKLPIHILSFSQQTSVLPYCHALAPLPNQRKLIIILFWISPEKYK